MPRNIALLRGINVGGKTVKMDRLRAALESLGYTGVQTYIQSGNVLFERMGQASAESIRSRMEEALTSEFDFNISIVLLSPHEMLELLDANPYAGQLIAQGERIYATVFQEEPSPAAVAALKPIPGSEDKFALLGRAAYILCRGGYADTAYSNAFFEKALRVKATTRNMDTMAKLAEMCRI
jgi:uncharacterized protein (DUF1697 family)